MIPFQQKIPGLLASDLQPAGRFLSVAILLIPFLQVLLYPDVTTGAGYVFYNILISLVEIIFVVLILSTSRVRGYPLNHTPFILWLGFFLWSMAVLATIADMPLQAGGIISSLRFLIHFLFFVALSSYLIRQPAAGRDLITAILLSLVLFLPAFWIKLYLIHDQPGFHWTWSLPGFTNVRHLDYFLGGVVTLLALWPLIRDGERSTGLQRLGHGLLLLLCWTMIFWSGGRGSAIAALGAITVILAFFRPRGWRALGLSNLAVMLSAAGLSLLLPAPNESYGLIRFLTKITEVDSLNAFSAGRLKIWAEAFDLWRQNPWFGVGAGQTKALITAASATFAQPHNVILQALMAWGLVGGLPFLGAIAGFFWRRGRALYYTATAPNPRNLVAYGLALTLAINALVDGTLYYPLPLFLFVIGVACSGITAKPSSN